MSILGATIAAVFAIVASLLYVLSDWIEATGAAKSGNAAVERGQGVG